MRSAINDTTDNKTNQDDESARTIGGGGGGERFAERLSQSTLGSTGDACWRRWRD